MTDPRPLLLSLCVAMGATALAGCWGRDQYLTGDGAIPKVDIEWHVGHALTLAESGRDAEAMGHWRKAITGGSREFDVLIRASRCASRIVILEDASATGRADRA